MGSNITKEDIQADVVRRRARILGYMTQDPPRSLAVICAAEGLHPRAGRALVKEIEEEHGLNYMGVHSRGPKDETPYGLTSATGRLRQKLADQLYLLRERGNDSAEITRNGVAPQVGLNSRAQLKAEQRPFLYDWKLSEIERLARALGRDPMEFMLSCLTT